MQMSAETEVQGNLCMLQTGPRPLSSFRLVLSTPNRLLDGAVPRPPVMTVEIWLDLWPAGRDAHKSSTGPRQPETVHISLFQAGPVCPGHAPCGGSGHVQFPREPWLSECSPPNVGRAVNQVGWLIITQPPSRQQYCLSLHVSSAI